MRRYSWQLHASPVGVFFETIGDNAHVPTLEKTVRGKKVSSNSEAQTRTGSELSIPRSRVESEKVEYRWTRWSRMWIRAQRRSIERSGFLNGGFYRDRALWWGYWDGGTIWDRRPRRSNSRNSNNRERSDQPDTTVTRTLSQSSCRRWVLPLPLSRLKDVMSMFHLDQALEKIQRGNKTTRLINSGFYHPGLYMME